MRYLLPLLMLLAGCSQKVIQSTSTIEKDSIHIDTVKTVKVVKKKGDSVGVAFKLPVAQIIYPEKTVKDPEQSLPFQAEDPIVFKKTEKQGRLTESVTISKKGNVVITCREDSLKSIIQQQRITIQKFKDVTTTETKTVVCPPKTKWESFCEWWTWLCIGAILGYVGYKLRKLLPFPINKIP